MASTGKWEIVGKGGKKRVPNNGRKNKVKASDMPKADIINPLAASKTIYQALDKSSPQVIGNGHITHSVPEELPAVLAERDFEQLPEIKKPFVGYISGKKKASAKPQRTEQELLQEALLKIDLDELTAMLSSLESSFPNNPSIWLRDLAAYLQLKLKGVPQKDPVFEGKPTNYPMCLLSTPLRMFFVNLLKTCSGPTLKLIFQHSLESMVLELSRGSSAYSDQLMIQCIVHCHPQITVTNSKEVLEMLDTRKTRTREALALMWCVGQLPHKNLSQALKVWLNIMMPQLGVKQLMKYAVSYLETVLSTCKPADIKEVIVQPKEFFQVMEIAFSPASPLSGNPSLQRKILALYPEIKRLAFEPSEVSSGSEYFSSLLSLLSNDLPLEYQQEVLGCLVFWLERAPECFGTWENSYVTNLPQSGLLLNHLVEIWNSSTKIPRGKLFQTVKAFQTKNNTILESSKSKAGLDICRKTCQALTEKKASRSLFPAFSRLFKFVVVVVLLVVAYDVYKHRGYKASKTSQILQQSGLEQAASGGYEYAKDKFSRANSWVQSRYPSYYSTSRLYLDPAMEFCWDKLTSTAKFLLEITKPARDYLNKKIPELLEKIEAEGPIYLGIARDHLKRLWDAFWPVIHNYIVIVWDFLSENVPVLLAKVQQLLMSLTHTVYDFAPDFFSMVASWFARLGEKITEKLPDVLAVIQEYAIIAFNLAVNLVNCLVEWVQGISGSAEVEDVTMAGPMKTAPK